MATIEEVLGEMKRIADQNLHDAASSNTIAGWLEALRPALAARQALIHHVGFDAEPDTETWPLTSHLEQSLLRDLKLMAVLDVDHEGGGTVQFAFNQVPHQHRMQALLSLMSAVGIRIELAIGSDAFSDLLRGVLARREREG